MGFSISPKAVLDAVMLTNSNPCPPSGQFNIAFHSLRVLRTYEIWLALWSI
jgi:hypothetical protein